MSKNILKTLHQVAKSVELLLRVEEKREEEIEKIKFHGVICKLKSSDHLNNVWTLEFINKMPTAIRIIKVSAESFFEALVWSSYSVPDHPSRDHKEPKVNPRDEIILRNIESNGSLTIEIKRELSYYPRNREVWMGAQISLDTKADETFPIKRIKVTIEV